VFLSIDAEQNRGDEKKIKINIVYDKVSTLGKLSKNK
jgi:hypothetical protein